MRAGPTAMFGAVALTACSPSHDFYIVSDEPIQGLEVDLENLRDSRVEVVGTHASVDVWAGDTSGEIRVQLASGKEVACKVGYITSGDHEPHIFGINERKCTPVIQE